MIALPVIGQVYPDRNWPADVAVIPLELRGDMVRVIVGRPALVSALTPHDRESIASTWVALDFFNRATSPA